MSNLMDEAWRKKLREVSYNQGFVDGVKMCERRIEKINDLINEKTTTMTRQEAASALEIILKEDEWLPPKAYKAISMGIDALNETDRSQWIPCSERMPEEHIGFYLVTKQKRRITELNVVSRDNMVYDIDIARWDYDRRTSQRDYHWCKVDKVIAWMPMPDPYQPEENDD